MFFNVEVQIIFKTNENFQKTLMKLIKLLWPAPPPWSYMPAPGKQIPLPRKNLDPRMKLYFILTIVKYYDNYGFSKLYGLHLLK